MDEPGCGFNYPPGVFNSTQDAPWNQPDPWEDMECRDCIYCTEVKLLSRKRILVCTFDDSLLMEVNGDQQACDGFE